MPLWHLTVTVTEGQPHPPSLAASCFGKGRLPREAPAAGRVVWTELLSNDPAAAALFYAAIVGFEARTEARPAGPYTLLAGADRDRAGILRNPSEQAAPVWLTYFGVDDPTAAARRAESLGGKVILWPTPQLRNGTMAVVTDATGALLVLRKAGA